MSELQIGQIVSVTEYNEIMQRKWKSDFNKFTEQARLGNRSWSEAPQLAFYLFFDKNGEPRKRGYVLKYKEGVMCFKTKRECILEKDKKGI